LLGYPAQALARLHEALALAHALSRPRLCVPRRPCSHACRNERACVSPWEDVGETVDGGTRPLLPDGRLLWTEACSAQALPACMDAPLFEEHACKHREKSALRVEPACPGRHAVSARSAGTPPKKAFPVRLRTKRSLLRELSLAIVQCLDNWMV